MKKVKATDETAEIKFVTKRRVKRVEKLNG